MLTKFTGIGGGPQNTLSINSTAEKAVVLSISIFMHVMVVSSP